jgi:hypothetical protein
MLQAFSRAIIFIILAPVGLAVAGSDRAQRSQAAPVPASDLAITVHGIDSPKRGATDQENYWIQYQVWGEMKNNSNRTVESISADITFYDHNQKPIAIDSITTAVKQDLGDRTPGDRIWGAVHFIPPGGSVPFHYRRNLRAIRGVFASHKLTLRPARAAFAAPVGVASAIEEKVGEMHNPQLKNSSSAHRMRSFAASLENQGASGCRDPKLVVALLVNGKIRELHDFDARQDGNHELVVAPGASVPVRGAVYVTFDDAWREKAAYRTWVDCEQPY